MHMAKTFVWYQGTLILKYVTFVHVWNGCTDDTSDKTADTCDTSGNIKCWPLTYFSPTRNAREILQITMLTMCYLLDIWKRIC